MIPSDFLALAERIVRFSDIKEVDESIKYRLGIGRAFYAAYYQSRDYLGIGEQYVRAKTMINRLRKKGGNHIPVANRFTTLKNMRIRADYKLKEPVSEADALESLRLCKVIIDGLEINSDEKGS